MSITHELDAVTTELDKTAEFFGEVTSEVRETCYLEAVADLDAAVVCAPFGRPAAGCGSSPSRSSCGS